jgi:phage terminase Nu1 subunit (DNA packaging protein)|tara:strand:+ start:898 stop:1143 length:246 start_codon:yes stop_codon:yes gene_type:complete
MVKRKTVTTTQLSKILQVSRQAIYKWRKRGCPVVVDNTGWQGKTIRYDYDEVVKWLNKRNMREKLKAEDVNLAEIDPYQSG